jgi:hypothetical protein
LVLFDYNLDTVYLFACNCLFVIAIGANDFENLQGLDFQDFEQQPAGEQGQ